jgi:tRNA U38,U39,U40 pseudouridine synthase TruA
LILFSEYQKSGRTDKGVSALGNVISLNVRKIDSSNTHENL